MAPAKNHISPITLRIDKTDKVRLLKKNYKPFKDISGLVYSLWGADFSQEEFTILQPKFN